MIKRQTFAPGAAYFPFLRDFPKIKDLLFDFWVKSLKETCSIKSTKILTTTFADGLPRQKFDAKIEKGVKILIIDLSKIKVENLSTEIKLLNILVTLRERENVIELPLASLEELLDVSHNTLKKFLRALRDANVLKFSLKGLFTLNPEVVDFTDICVPPALNILRYNYSTFQSD